MPNQIVTIKLHVSLGALEHMTDSELRKWLGEAAVEEARQELAKRARLARG